MSARSRLLAGPGHPRDGEGVGLGFIATTAVMLAAAQLEERELIVLLMSAAALGYLLLRRRVLLSTPGSGLQVGALSALLVGLSLTNLEVFTQGRVADQMNVMEHVAYGLHTALLAAYVFRCVRSERGAA